MSWFVGVAEEDKVLFKVAYDILVRRYVPTLMTQENTALLECSSSKATDMYDVDSSDMYDD